MTPQELKNSILQLAVQGRLVEQRLNEGTGDDLYCQIQIEKSQLIKEGKVKKGKTSPVVSDDEKPFDIPENWKWVRLSEITTLISDGTHKTPKYVDYGIPFLSVKDISRGFMDFSNTRFITPEEHKTLTQRCKPELNDVLICRIGTLGKALRIDTDIEFSIFVSLGLIKLVDKSIASYIELVINSGYGFSWIQKVKVGGGTHTFKINLDDLRLMPIPLPPIREQKRILDRVSDFMPACSSYEKAWLKLEELNKRFPMDLRKSILQFAVQGSLVEQRPEEGTSEEWYKQVRKERKRLIEEGAIKEAKSIAEISDDEIPFDIPDSWKWFRIGEVFDLINGFTPLRTNPEFWSEKDIPWFTIDDVHRQGRFITTTEKYISQKALPKKTNRIVPPDSVLLCCTASVGEYAYTKIALTTNQQFNAFVTKLEFKNAVYPMYVYEYVKTLKDALIKNAGKTTFNFLSVSKLSSLLIPIPPLAEQKRIVAKLEEILPLCDRITS